MYRSLRYIVISAIAIIAMMLSFGTSYAAPAAPTFTVTPGVAGKAVELTVKNGTIELSKDKSTLSIVNSEGKTVNSFPLWIELFGEKVALDPTLNNDDSFASLVPIITPLVKAALTVHLASAKSDAYNNMAFHVNNGWVRDGVIYTAIGAVSGLVIGCLVVVGCIWGAGVGAAIGAAVGIGQGDPLAAQSIIDYINTP